MSEYPSTRETLSLVLFVLAVVVIFLLIMDGKGMTLPFWIAAMVALIAFVTARKRAALVTVVFAFGALRFAFGTVVFRRWEALVGLVVCSAIAYLLLRFFPHGDFRD